MANVKANIFCRETLGRKNRQEKKISSTTLEKMPFKARGGRIIGSPFWLAGQYAKWTGQNADHKVRKKKAKERPSRD